MYVCWYLHKQYIYCRCVTCFFEFFLLIHPLIFLHSEMSQSWMDDRYHVYIWILDIVIFRPDKFCSQVVVRGNVSSHRWSTYMLKQSMIESGYIIDGASFVLSNSFCHRECIVVGPVRSGAAFEPNSWAGFVGTPPKVGSPSSGCSRGGGVLDAQPPHWAWPPWACRLRAAQVRASCAEEGREGQSVTGLVLEAAAVPHSDRWLWPPVLAGSVGGDGIPSWIAEW